MTGNVIIFPSTRRHAMILTAARTAAGTRTPGKTIAAVLARTRAMHERKGLPADAIAADLRNLEMALQTYLAHCMAERGLSA